VAGAEHRWPCWRNACVVRARTIAADLRLIEFAVEGGLPAFGGDARTRVRPLQSGEAVAGSYVCVNVGEGRMRVLVSGAADGAARFMWSLIEGARVRLTVPQSSQRHCAMPVRIVAGTGVRLRMAASGLVGTEQARPGRPRLAANGNVSARQQFLV